jgi:cell division protein FtsQ
MLKRFKEINWRKVFHLVMWMTAALCFIISVGFTQKRQAEMLCKGVNIQIKNPDDGFVDQSDVLQMIHDKYGMPEGKPMNAINISLLENIINNNPFVSRAEVFSSVDGKLNVEVTPRNPIVRIINNQDESFYIDEEGTFMPLSEKYSASVPLANGFISDNEALHKIRLLKEREVGDTSIHARTIEKVYMLADYLRNHDFWNAQVQQVYVNEDGDIELIPRVGNHTIIIGDLSGQQAYEKEMDEKFGKLFLFYKEGLNKQGWDRYKTINLKYKDQVVCTKKTVNGK